MKFLFRSLVVILCINHLAFADPKMNDVSDEELRDMLSNIEGELESRGVSIRDKYGRIQKAESRFKKLVNRGSWKNAVIGSVLTAAVTAHPAGLLVGGLAGSMVGKSKRYDDAEEQLAVIEHEIIVDEDDFLTEGEVRLAAFADDITPKEEVYQESSETMLVDMPEVKSDELAADAFKKESPQKIKNATAVASGQVAQFVASNADSATANQMQQASNNYKTAQPSKPELESCYGRSVGDRKTREQLPHCFYMMY